MENLVSYETIGPVARIFHNRPDKGNAQSRALLEEMDAAFDRAKEDPDIRVVILGGHGKHFSAGHDIADAAEERPDPTVEDRYRFEQKIYYDICLNIWDFPKPTIAQVQGACIAGGFMTANMCDLIVASDDAVFSDPVVNLFGAAAVEVLIHPYVMGHRAAKDFLLTGRKMSAEEGYRLGMVSRLTTREMLEQTTLDLAQDIAKAPPFAAELTKKSINRSLDMAGFRNALAAHFDTHQMVHASDEAQVLTRELMGKYKG